MARRGKIERYGLENRVLELAREGQGSRAIKSVLESEVDGFKISHSAVSRFLRDEAEDRELQRRASSAEKANQVAGRAGEHTALNPDELQAAFGVLALIGRTGCRRIGGVDGIEVVTEVVEAEFQIKAIGEMRQLGKYLIELAAANPRPLDPRSLQQVRSIVSEVFGYAEQADEDDPLTAPPSDDEHQPPIMH